MTASPATDVETGAQSSPHEPSVVPSRFEVRPTGYEASRLEDKGHFTLSVEHRGKDRWAVVNREGEVLTADGTFEHEPQPSSRSEAFLARTRFGRESALERALEIVDTIKVGSRTFTEWNSFFTPPET